MASPKTGIKPPLQKGSPISHNPNLNPSMAKPRGLKQLFKTWNLALKAFGMTTTGKYWLIGGATVFFSYLVLSPMYNTMFWSMVYSTPNEWNRLKNWASNEPARSDALAEYRERQARALARKQATQASQGPVVKSSD